MKNALFIISFFICSFSFSQTYNGYVPFPTKNAYWVEHGENVSQHSPDKCVDYEYRFAGDTVISTFQYSVIERTEIDQTTPNGCGPPWNAQISVSTFGYLRNDSANKKVWLRFPNSNQDTLFYDFDFNVGDTIGNGDFYMSPPFNQVVDSVDTVYLGGRYRRKLYYSNPCGSPGEYDFIIEGVGAKTGFSFNNSCLLAGTNNSLICMGDSLGGIYPDSTTCNLITSISKKTKVKNEIQLSPNPTNGILKLQTQAQLKSIEVYNLQGQKVQEVSLTRRRWELPEKSGLYLIRIQDEEGRVFTEKIIKN